MFNLLQYYHNNKNSSNQEVRIRCITEINHKNVKECKKLLPLITELRHIERIKKNIVTIKSNYIPNISALESPLRKEITNGISEKEINLAQLTFNTLWINSILSTVRINQIEQSNNFDENLKIETDEFLVGLNDYTDLYSNFNSSQKVNLDVSIFSYLLNQVLVYHLFKNFKNSESDKKMQMEFIDIIAHELRTPIQPIIGLSTHLCEQLEDEKQKDIIHNIYTSAQRLQEFVETILDIIKYENNLIKIKKNMVNLNDLIVEIIKYYQFKNLKKDSYYKFYNHDLKNIKFELLGFDKVHIVYVDINLIKQVISQLIINSINFVTNTKYAVISINISKLVQENYLVVQIKDNGVGFHPDVFPNLFKKFSTKSYYGSGLGLYICKQIILLHNGNIWAENNKDQKGAMVSFSLPLI